MRISDWSSDVCSSDLPVAAAADLGKRRIIEFAHRQIPREAAFGDLPDMAQDGMDVLRLVKHGPVVGEPFHPVDKRCDSIHLVADQPGERFGGFGGRPLQQLRRPPDRSEEHTSELQSLMRISYAVFCLK